jgi:hypothetical protein
MKYDLKYIQKNYESTDAIHLDMGNILHKALEIKYRNVIDGKDNAVFELKEIIENGIAEETEKDKGNFIQGLKQIKDKYGENTFNEINEKSNLSYNDKLSTFFNYLEHDQLEDDWKPFKVEFDFEFIFGDKALINGFIDRVDINSNGDLRVVDYKSSNKVYQHKDLTTPLQMVIYALACENEFGRIPIEYQYDMILLGDKQQACTKGFYKRGTTKLSKILDDIKECEETGIFKPKPTPLCHWCEFSQTNPGIPFYFEGLCEYYSLWTPENRTFEKNKEYINIDNLQF